MTCLEETERRRGPPDALAPCDRAPVVTDRGAVLCSTPATEDLPTARPVLLDAFESSLA
jgi:hypothetical protein